MPRIRAQLGGVQRPARLHRPHPRPGRENRHLQDPAPQGTPRLGGCACRVPGWPESGRALGGRAEDVRSWAGQSPPLRTRSGFRVSLSLGRGFCARDAEEPVESLTSERGFVEAALEQLRSE